MIQVKRSTHILIRIGFLSTLMTLVSCSPEYIPNMANTPMFDSKGDIQANVSAGVSGYDFQGAYALTDHVGAMVNTSFKNQTSDTTQDYHKHSIYELGLGYYGDLGEYGRYEIFGGFGTGNIQALNEGLEFDNPYTDAIFSKVFIQPSIGFKSEVFDANLGTRVAMVKVNYQQTAEGLNEKFQPFAEPVLTGRLGFKYVKLVSQVGFSIPLTNEYVFDYQPFIISLGVHFTINTREFR